MRLKKRINKYGTSWYIDFIDHTGKRRYHSLKGIVTPKGAELAFADFRLKFERGQLGLATERNITLDAAIEALIQDRECGNCSDVWIKTLEYLRGSVTRFFGKDCLLKSLSDDAIGSYRHRRSSVDKKLPETVNKELNLIAAAGRLALKEGKITKLPWRKITYAIDRSGREAWSYMKADEIKKLLTLLRYGGRVTTLRDNGRPLNYEFKPKPRLWGMITFLLNTGARRGEMFAVRWSDIDLHSKVVRIVGSKSAKNGTSAVIRYVPMNSALEESFSVMPRGNERDLVFKHYYNLRRDFRHALKCAGLPAYRVHDLRHTFASHLAMAGTPLYTIGKLLGHSTVQMTQRYAHLCPDTLANAVQSLKFSSEDKGESECAAKMQQDD